MIRLTIEWMIAIVSRIIMVYCQEIICLLWDCYMWKTDRWQ